MKQLQLSPMQAQHRPVAQVIGELSDTQKSAVATPSPSLLRLYVTDYMPSTNLVSFVARYQKLIRTGAEKRSIRLDVLKGADDPRNPWNNMRIRLFVGRLVELHPEIVMFLDMPSLAIIERCLRVERNAGGAELNPSLLTYRISDRKGFVWQKLAQRFGFDPACTDSIDLGVCEPAMAKMQVFNVE